MKTLSCASTRRRLQAFHDGELAIGEQIAVSAHVEWCPRCARALAEIREVGSALQALAARTADAVAGRRRGVHGTVVNRFKAEDAASLFSRVRVMFSDMRLGYAGLGATAATMVCVVIALGMMHFAPPGTARFAARDDGRHLHAARLRGVRLLRRLAAAAPAGPSAFSAPTSGPSRTRCSRWRSW